MLVILNEEKSIIKHADIVFYHCKHIRNRASHNKPSTATYPWNELGFWTLIHILISAVFDNSEIHLSQFDFVKASFLERKAMDEYNVTNDTNHATDEEHMVGTVILFLSSAVLLACVAKLILSQVLKNKIPAPFTVIVLILGFLLGVILAHIEKNDDSFLHGEEEIQRINPHLLFYIFLPLLIFDSAFNSHFHVMRPQVISGILLAGPGIFISMIMVAICTVYIFPYDWSWIDGLMIGSILSATDPVAVVALLHESGASKSMAALIDLESLLNDGSAFVAFSIFYDILIKQTTTPGAIIGAIAKFTIGGPAFGLVSGILMVTILNFVNNESEVEIISTFCVAYFIFYLADSELGISAVLALVVMGLYMAKNKHCISSHVQLALANTWKIMIYFINILIFMITGIILAESLVATRDTIEANDFGFSIVLYVFLHVARLLTIVGLYPFIKWSGAHFSWKEYVLLTWSGLRGSMALILALIVKSDNAIDELKRNRILFHVCMIALLTLVINGTSTKLVVKFLRLDHGTPEKEIILLQAFEHLRKETCEQIFIMKREKQFADVDWSMVKEYLPDKLVEELDARRRTSIHGRLSISPMTDTIESIMNPQEASMVNDIELQEVLTTTDNCSTFHQPDTTQQDSSENELGLPTVDLRITDDHDKKKIYNELITRLLTALSATYERQWFLGMIRRRTLDTLIDSVEKAKTRSSVNLHWELVLRQLRFSFFLRCLLRFRCVNWIQKLAEKMIFDHMLYTIEIVLAFHSAQTHIENIRRLFPEVAAIDPQVWNNVCQETNYYYQIAAYILVDLKETFRACWQIQMTKRCSQMLLKFESALATELNKSGMLEDTELAHIVELIEKKTFDLEFFQVKLPKYKLKSIASPFDELPLFRLLSEADRQTWKTIMNSKLQWFQSGTVVLEEKRIVSASYLILRGIIGCKQDTHPVYYRSGSIIGIDALFESNSPASSTYFVAGGVAQLAVIDSTLLSQLLENETLSPMIYQEITLHHMAKKHEYDLKLSRSQLKWLLHNKAEFYQKQVKSIRLDIGDRIFLLSGSVVLSSSDMSQVYNTIQLYVFESTTEIHLENSTVLYKWNYQDELSSINNNRDRFPLPTQIFGSISNTLLYPRYSIGIQSNTQHHSMEMLSYVTKLQDKDEGSLNRQTNF